MLKERYAIFVDVNYGAPLSAVVDIYILVWYSRTIIRYCYRWRLHPGTQYIRDAFSYVLA